MSDLIRREDVIKLVNQFVFGLCKEQNDEARKTFIKHIEKIPTAYDVNKVIEELESSKGLAACEGRRCNECVYSSICMEGEQSERVAIDKAIKIVKAGGIRKEND